MMCFPSRLKENCGADFQAIAVFCMDVAAVLDKNVVATVLNGFYMMV